MEAQNEKVKKDKGTYAFKLRSLVTIWLCTIALIVTLYVLSQTVIPEIIKPATFQFLSNVLAIASFLVTSLLSFVVMRHSDIVNERDRKNNDEINARNEAFRKLQFIASNYSAVDFVDHMLMYEVYKSYTDELKSSKNFMLYMREEGTLVEDVIADFNKFHFIHVRIPIIPLSGADKSVTGIKFSNFIFHKQEVVHTFIPCGNEERNTLILYNKETGRQEVGINLIVKKESNFWDTDKVNPFNKISFNHTMNSLLGVALSGRTELYFVNPQKAEKSGANRYTINSSQFEIAGLPVLSANVEKDIMGQA